MCEALGLHPSGYYAWLKHPISQRGYKTPKGYYSGARDNVTANQLQHEFDVAAPNQWWVSDITYIHTQEGFLFLAVVMDLYARNIVGWSMSHRITDDLSLDALTMAYWRRKPEQTVRLHSDQGSQYTSRRFRKLLDTLNIEARQAIFNYIEMFYNPKRRHTSNGRRSPSEYELQYFQNLKIV